MIHVYIFYIVYVMLVNLGLSIAGIKLIAQP